MTAGREDDGSGDGVSSVRVEIAGEDYVIRTDMDEEYTRRCAEYVDEAIRDAHLGLHVSEPHKAAILAALQITDQLFQARERSEDDWERISSRINEITERISSAVETDAGEDGSG